MPTDRANSICLLQILQEYSDEEHILPMRDIIAKLKSIYDVSVDRRTVYSAIEMLTGLGYDISNYEDNGKGYYLRQRDFEPSEIRLLMDAVYSFPYISGKQTTELTGKLQKLLSLPRRKEYRNLFSVRNQYKTQNKAVFLNIELLDEAISKKMQIQFDYLCYGLDKGLHRRRDEKYTVNPYGMVCSNEHYYLICRMAGYPSISFYRIDLIESLRILDEPAEPADGIDFNADAAKTTYAFTGEPELIRLRCKNYIIGDVLDRFGTEVSILPNDGEHFIARFYSVPFGIKFWALQYLPHVEVLEPQHLRDGIIEYLNSSPY